MPQRALLAADRTVRLAELRHRQGRLKEAEDALPRGRVAPAGPARPGRAGAGGRPAKDAEELIDRFLRQVPESSRTQRAAAYELLVRAQALLGDHARGGQASETRAGAVRGRCDAAAAGSQQLLGWGARGRRRRLSRRPAPASRMPSTSTSAAARPTNPPGRGWSWPACSSMLGRLERARSRDGGGTPDILTARLALSTPARDRLLRGHRAAASDEQARNRRTQPTHGTPARGPAPDLPVA